MFRAATVIATVALAGCQSARPDMVFNRADGKSIKQSATYTAHFERDTTICRGEGAKAAQAGGVVHYQGLAGAIAADQTVAKMNRNVDTVIAGCMAEKGYVLVSPTQ